MPFPVRAGIRAAVVRGDCDHADRFDVLARFRAGEIDAICTAPLNKEALHAAGLEYCRNDSPTGVLMPDGRHLVLQANHPSPLSALRPPQPFIGCDHFLLADRFLQSKGQKPIDW